MRLVPKYFLTYLNARYKAERFVNAQKHWGSIGHWIGMRLDPKVYIHHAYLKGYMKGKEEASEKESK